MTTTATQERRKRLVNRVGRHLPCNTIHVIRDFVKVATKVVDNILEQPHEVKFRELRANNKTIRRAVLSCHGGREFLHLLGFERIMKHAEAVYFLSEPEEEHLFQAKGWLHERAKACEETEGASTGGPCADSVLTVMLSSGQTLEGGFYKHELVQDVYAFLQATVVNTGEVLRLRTTKSPAKELDEKMLPVTLTDANLVPRATLVVIKPGSSPVPSTTREHHSEEEEASEALRLLQKHSARRKRDDEDAQKANREVMDKFKSDHSLDQRPRSTGVEESKGGRR